MVDELWLNQTETIAFYFPDANVVVKTGKCHEQHCRLNQYGMEYSPWSENYKCSLLWV